MRANHMTFMKIDTHTCMDFFFFPCIFHPCHIFFALHKLSFLNYFVSFSKVFKIYAQNGYILSNWSLPYVFRRKSHFWGIKSIPKKMMIRILLQYHANLKWTWTERVSRYYWRMFHRILSVVELYWRVHQAIEDVPVLSVVAKWDIYRASGQSGQFTSLSRRVDALLLLEPRWAIWYQSTEKPSS